MKIGDLVIYKDMLYKVTHINWSSLVNRFKLSPVASYNSDNLTLLLDGDIYISNSEELELFVGVPPKYHLGQRVTYDSNYYSIRFIWIKNRKYEYQIKAEESGRGMVWVFENELY